MLGSYGTVGTDGCKVLYSAVRKSEGTGGHVGRHTVLMWVVLFALLFSCGFLMSSGGYFRLLSIFWILGYFCILMQFWVIHTFANPT